MLYNTLQQDLHKAKCRGINFNFYHKKILYIQVIIYKCMYLAEIQDTAWKVNKIEVLSYCDVSPENRDIVAAYTIVP
jgi:hypothetical protein